MAEKVFCQITGRNISTEMCVNVQQTHETIECFGCGACSRLCGECRQRKPVSPEIGLCCACIGKQLTKEKCFKRKGFENRSNGVTLCPIVNKEISAEMCFATQGTDGCRMCSSPFRLCEGCNKRLVYFAPYGLCLHCGLQEYAPIWLKIGAADLESLADLVCTFDVSSDSMLEQSRLLVVSTQRASAHFISHELDISYQKAQALLLLLEMEGVIGRADEKKSRPILVQPTDDLPAVNGKISYSRACDKCGRKAETLHVAKRRLCMPCARKHSPLTWTKGVRNARQLIAVIDELYEEAVSLAVRQRYVTQALLKETFCIGRSFALQLLDRLESNGVISSNPEIVMGQLMVMTEKKVQSLLSSLSKKASADQQEAGRPLCSSCTKRPALVSRRRSALCIGCARNQYGGSWTRALQHCEDTRDLVMAELGIEALDVILELGMVSTTIIQSRLCIGYRLAHQVVDWLVAKKVVGSSTKNLFFGHRTLLEEKDYKQLPPYNPKNRGGFNYQQKSEIREAKSGKDPLIEQAKLLVIAERKASQGLLKSRLHIGESHARALLNQLVKEDIVRKGRDSTRRRVTYEVVPMHSVPTTGDRIDALNKLVDTLQQGDTCEILKATIADLRELERLREKRR